MRRTALRTIVLAAVTAVLSALLPSPAQASPWMYVFIEHLPAETCLAIASGADGAIPSQEQCVDTGFQLWTFEDAVAGHYRIRNIATGKCLANGGTTVVRQLSCADGPAQMWDLTGSGHVFRISNVSVGRCIARHSLSGAIVLGTCVPSSSQWHLLY